MRQKRFDCCSMKVSVFFTLLNKVGQCLYVVCKMCVCVSVCAGDGGHGYLKDWLWWGGLLTSKNFHLFTGINFTLWDSIIPLVCKKNFSYCSQVQFWRTCDSTRTFTAVIPFSSTLLHYGGWNAVLVIYYCIFINSCCIRPKVQKCILAHYL